MSKTASADPPDVEPPADPGAPAPQTPDPAAPDPAETEPAETEPAAPDPDTPKRPWVSRDTAVGAGATIVAALIGGVFALNQQVIVVPALTGDPSYGTLQQSLDNRNAEIDRLDGENQHLAAENETLDGDNQQLTSDKASLERQVADLQAQLGETTGDGGGGPLVEEYKNVAYEIVGAEASDRTAFVDLDTRETTTMRDSEWWETDDAGGPDADLAVTPGGVWSLEWSGTGTWFSAASAPTTPGACQEAAEGIDEEQIDLDLLTERDVICMTTTSGAVARITITDVNAENHPPQAAFTVTLWK